MNFVMPSYSVTPVTFDIKVDMATKRKMREEWPLNNEFRPWMRCVEGDRTRARCTTCKTEFGAELSTIKRHKVCYSTMHECISANTVPADDIFQCENLFPYTDSTGVQH